MTSRWIRAGLAAGIIVLAATTPRAQVTTAEALFREALAKERAEGTLKDAVFGYERIIATFATDRQAAGKAMYQLALIYEKLGDPRATVLLNRLVRDYSTVEPAASRAKARLKALQSVAASPFLSVELDTDYELGSPDGTLVIYHKDSMDWGRLYVKELATGKERVLVDESGASVSNIAWSPDSRKLTYNFNAADNSFNDIRIAEVDSSESRSLPAARGYPTAWTAANEILYYRPDFKAGTIGWWLVAAGGGDPRQILAVPLSAGSSELAVTPDGTRTIVSKSKKLHVQDMKTGQSRALTTGTWEESRPQVSADGRLVAFQANPDGRWGLYVAPLDGALPVAKPLQLAGLREPTSQEAGWLGRTWWTTAGLLTYFNRFPQSDLYRIEMDHRTGRPLDRPVRLTQDASENYGPSVSPDSRSVAYWARNGTRGGLAVMDAEGTNERPLVDQSLVLSLFWRTPSEILYRRAKPGGTGAIPIVSLNLDTGLEQELARPEGVYWWYNPDRREILHVYPKGGGSAVGAVLKALSLAEGKDRVVAQIDFLAPELALTLDGKRVAYGVNRPVPGSAKLVSEIGLLPVEGGPRVVLIPSEAGWLVPMAWSPDGRYLLYKSEAKGALVMDVASRESWSLCRDSGDADFCKKLDTDASWSPNGAFIVIGRSEPPRVERLAWEGVTAEAVAKLMRRQ